jgi:hypothetical protein
MISQRVATMTGIEFERYDCCINSCLAYTGVYSEAEACPHCHEPRFERGKPRKTFDYIPLIHRFRLQYADPKRATLLKQYRPTLEENPWEGVRDYWDGLLYKEQKVEGLFEDEHDIGLAFSTDGLSLFNVRQFSVWPIILLNLNLPPQLRVKKENILLCGIIPGPASPKDIHSFLFPLVEELKELEEGVPNVDDGSTKSQFTLNAYLCFCSGDLPAIAKVMGISGHNSYDYCRFCTITGIYKNHVYCPLRTPHGWEPVQQRFQLNPNDITLRTDEEYRNAAEHLSQQYNPVNDKTEYGLRHLSPLFQLKSISFPQSFPNDLMHNIFENVIRTLHKVWTNKYFPDGDDRNSDLVIPEAIWKRMGKDMESSRKLIPRSYGRAPRDIYKYFGSFKAEEWCSFLLYYSPILLVDVLPRDIYEHYMKLVVAIELAIDYEVTFEDIAEVKRLLHEFVLGYERLYYRYEEARISLCLPTVHLLLHLGESLENCGPAWVYWQFCCERVCGMLKPKCKNRSGANRNLSIRIIRGEQLNHLPFVSDFTEPSQQRPMPHFVASIETGEYGFLRPFRIMDLDDGEAKILAEFYASFSEKRVSRREILSSPQFSMEICKYGRCKLAGDKDTVSSKWCESRRDADTIRLASTIQYIRRGDEIGYGKVLFFVLHEYEPNEPRMLAFVESFRVQDASKRIEGIPEDKVLEVKGNGRREVICVSKIIAGIGLMKCKGKDYAVCRRINIPDEEF